jgi:hypothetical protein
MGGGGRMEGNGETQKLTCAADATTSRPSVLSAVSGRGFDCKFCPLTMMPFCSLLGERISSEGSSVSEGWISEQVCG